MLSEYDQILLDLDNTLIDENLYLFEAYKSIARDSQNCESNFDWIKTRYLTVGRSNLLSDYCSHFNLQSRLEDYLQLLRTVNVELNTLDPVEDMIGNFKGSVYLVTNGNCEQQSNKVSSLQTGLTFEVILASRFVAPKPMTYCVQNLVSCDASTLVIGDSIIDKKFADNLGVDFLHVFHSRSVDGLIISDSIGFELYGA